MLKGSESNIEADLGLRGWRDCDHGPCMRSTIDAIGDLKDQVDDLTNKVVAATAAGDFVAADELFYDELLPTFDDGFDADLDEVLERQDAHLRESFGRLGGAAGRSESRLGGSVTDQIAEASGDVAQAQIGADFTAGPTDAAIELVQPVLDGDVDVDEVIDERTDRPRHERRGITSGSTAWNNG